MAFIVENGTNVPNANSYVDVGYSKEYFGNKGVSTWSAFTDEEIQQRLVIATQYVDTIYYSRFKGFIAYEDQSLLFPRDIYYTEIDGKKFYLMPSLLLKATCEYALNIDSETMSLTTVFDTSDTGGEVKRKKEVVGAIETETEYFSSSSNAKTELSSYVLADNIIKPLLKQSNVLRCIRN